MGFAAVAAAKSLLGIDYDLAEMLSAGLILEGRDELIQREMSIYHRAQPSGIDRADKILLMASAADQHCLQTHLPR